MLYVYTLDYIYICVCSLAWPRPHDPGGRGPREPLGVLQLPVLVADGGGRLQAPATAGGGERARRGSDHMKMMFVFLDSRSNTNEDNSNKTDTKDNKSLSAETQ